MATTWHFRINDGPENTVTTESTIYDDGVREAFLSRREEATTPEGIPTKVEIWVPDLLPDYGPYDYYVLNEGEELVVKGKGGASLSGWI